MSGKAKDHTEGPFASWIGDTDPEEPGFDPWNQPLPLQNPRGRPSNWAKKQMQDALRAAQPESHQASPPKKATKGRRKTIKSPEVAVDEPSPPRATRASTRRITLRVPPGNANPAAKTIAGTLAPTPALTDEETTARPRGSRLSTPQSATGAINESAAMRDDDSLFEGDANSLFSGHDNSSQLLPAAQTEYDDDGDSLFCGNDEPEQLHKTIQPGQTTSDRHWEQPRHVQEQLQIARCRPGHLSTPFGGENIAKLEREMSAISTGVRSMEQRIAQQVGNEMHKMTNLVQNLAASTLASKPPPAMLAKMLSIEDQVKFRNEVIHTTQINLKVHLVQALEKRDEKNRKNRLLCQILFAVAIVLAAFLVSPFAPWLVAWVERMIFRSA